MPDPYVFFALISLCIATFAVAIWRSRGSNDYIGYMVKHTTPADLERRTKKRKP